MKFELREMHARFGGARYFLTGERGPACGRGFVGLNAPYGARCFLTFVDENGERVNYRES